MQGTWDWSLVQKDLTCRGATKPVSHATEPVYLEPVRCNKRRDRSEKPMHHSEEEPLPATTRESRAQQQRHSATNKEVNLRL